MVWRYIIPLSSTLIITVLSSALYGPCDSNENCGTLDTYCKNGTCICKEEFVIFYDHCVQLATPHINCLHKSNCSATLGQKGFCKNQKCVCKSFHHFHNHQCIKSRRLDEKCESDHQCYCGHGCNDNIFCNNGLCECKYGFKKYGSKCVPDPSAPPITQPPSESSSSKAVSFGFFWIMFFAKIIYF